MVYPWWLERPLSSSAVEMCCFPAHGCAGFHLDTHSLLECREGEYEILPAMVNMPFSCCYSKEAGKCCQVTAVFNKKSQVSGAEEKGRLISPGSAWLVCGSSRALCTGCWHTQCPGSCETPVMSPPKPSEIPQPWPSLLPAASSLLPARPGQQGVGRWPWRAPICRDPGVPLPPSHHLA